MAQTLYLLDGSTEIVFGNPEETLQRVIRERLGRDCEELFTELLEEARHPLGGGDDFEKIADGYLSALNSTMEEISSVLKEFDKARLDRAKVHRRLKNIWNDLYKNL